MEGGSMMPELRDMPHLDSRIGIFMKSSCRVLKSELTTSTIVIATNARIFLDYVGVKAADYVVFRRSFALFRCLFGRRT